MPIAKEHQAYLCFSWVNLEGVRRIYAYTCLPNGFSSAPRDFTKLFKPPLAHLRLLGVTIAVYIDDRYIHSSTAEECAEHVDLTKSYLKTWGFGLT